MLPDEDVAARVRRLEKPSRSDRGHSAGFRVGPRTNPTMLHLLTKIMIHGAFFTVATASANRFPVAKSPTIIRPGTNVQRVG